MLQGRAEERSSLNRRLAKFLLAGDIVPQLNQQRLGISSRKSQRRDGVRVLQKGSTNRANTPKLVSPLFKGQSPLTKIPLCRGLPNQMSE
jgi:hypothetical protein